MKAASAVARSCAASGASEREQCERAHESGAREARALDADPTLDWLWSISPAHDTLRPGRSYYDYGSCAGCLSRRAPRCLNEATRAGGLNEMHASTDTDVQRRRSARRGRVLRHARRRAQRRRGDADALGLRAGHHRPLARARASLLLLRLGRRLPRARRGRLVRRVARSAGVSPGGRDALG